MQLIRGKRFASLAAGRAKLYCYYRTISGNSRLIRDRSRKHTRRVQSCCPRELVLGSIRFPVLYFVF
jgi:hypothetical protein